MIAYKLFRRLSNGNITPLFINKKQIIPLNRWLPAKKHAIPGFKVRAGWHAAPRPVAPHLSTKGRVWAKVELEDVETLSRPKFQGDVWFIAKKMRVLKIL